MTLVAALSVAAQAVGVELPGLWSLTPYGAVLGLAVLFYWLVASGRLIPKGTHDLILATEVKRGNEWKETALAVRETNTALLEQNSALLEGARTTAAVLRASAPDSTIFDTHTGGA